MRQLIRRREIVNDDWRYADEDPQGRDRALILPFARWQQERNRWWLWDGRLGVRLGPTDPVAALEQDFLRVSLVAIEFGGIAEGRGYSQAQLLRKRYKFSGELRAVGKIQRDQLFYLARCGFDSFELPEGADLQGALTAFDDFSVAYQGATDAGCSSSTACRAKAGSTACPCAGLVGRASARLFRLSFDARCWSTSDHLRIPMPRSAAARGAAHRARSRRTTPVVIASSRQRSPTAASPASPTISAATAGDPARARTSIASTTSSTT